jgi:hypothetical protein
MSIVRKVILTDYQNRVIDFLILYNIFNLSDSL